MAAILSFKKVASIRASQIECSLSGGQHYESDRMCSLVFFDSFADLLIYFFPCLHLPIQFLCINFRLLKAFTLVRLAKFSFRESR